MFNNLIIVGRLTKDASLKNLDSGKKLCELTIAVQRKFKNIEGNYETDFIHCTLWDSLALSALNYGKKGSIIGVKGRLQVRKVENDKYTFYQNEVIAENVTFIAKNKKEFDKELNGEEFTELSVI